MSDITTIEIVGPFLPEYRVTFNGYRVPHITARPMDDGRVDVIVDNRFGMEAPISREEFDRWVPLIANAMAVAAGYSCIGDNCTDVNPFKTRMSRLGPLKPNLTVVPADQEP